VRLRWPLCFRPKSELSTDEPLSEWPSSAVPPLQLEIHIASVVVNKCARDFQVSRVSKARASAGAPGDVPPRASADVPADRYVSGLPRHFPCARDRQHRIGSPAVGRRRVTRRALSGSYDSEEGLSGVTARPRASWLAHSLFRPNSDTIRILDPRSSAKEPRQNRPMSLRLSRRFSFIGDVRPALVRFWNRANIEG